MKKKLRKRWGILITSVLVLVVLSFATWFFLIKKPIIPGDYSQLSWSRAFDQMYKQLSREYAFTEWKQVDWNSLYDEYAPRIRKAQNNHDFNAYYVTLRGFLTEIPDGHVSLTNLKDIDDLYIGGGFGFSSTKLSDGTIITSWIDEAGPAYTAGMRVGDILIEWNNEPIRDALTHVSTIFAGSSATTENLELKQVQYLTRAPIGTETEVTFMNTGTGSSNNVTLTAFDDGRLSLEKSYPSAVLSDKIRSLYLGIDDPHPIPDSMVETKTFEDNIFYIKLWGELDADLKESGTTPSTLELFRKAINSANTQHASAIILDIRNNLGGLDDMSAAILGSFYSDKTLYEYQNIYNESTGKRELQPVNGEDALYIEPSEEYFAGKIVCLINQKCVSSGEGIALGIKNLSNGETLGYYGTSGSFGLAGAEVKMPNELTVHFPFGQSLDKDHNIQLDSKDGVGGVSPSVRIEMTPERAIRATNGEDVELEEAVGYIHSQNSSAD